MAASSSRSQKCDVFISFRGEDVRSGFLSHLRERLDHDGSINTFNDNEMERSCQIGRELESAIKEARIFIVIFSTNYASSKWCLDELAEIHNCYKELKQKVIPVFYKIDPSEVRKQNGEFGKVFMKTCEGKSDDEKQRWKQALTDVANLAGEHLKNWSDEASMVKKIASDVFGKLLPQSNGFGDFVGIEAHIEAMESILCLESEVKMVGIWGQSGIGKSTLGRALFGHLSPKFPLHAFVTYKSTDEDVFGMKLRWEKQLLLEIFKKNIEGDCLGMVEQMLKHKKVFIVLDDVFKPVFLETLVGKTEWFGPGSRIIVISQDRHLLEAHKIDVLYEVKIPAPVIALKMLCRSAFEQDSPLEGFKELAAEVAKVAGDLPLGLSVLGSSLKGRTKEEWMEVLPELENGLEEDIMKVLRVSYNRLKEKDRCLFLWVACFFNGKSVKFINDFFGDGNFGLKRLAEKSLIRIIESEDKLDKEVVEMHNLLEKLGKEIERAESNGNPGKRRFLSDAKEIEDVFNLQKGTETVLGIEIEVSALKSYFSLDEKSFQGMSSLQVLCIDNRSAGSVVRASGASAPGSTSKKIFCRGALKKIFISRGPKKFSFCPWVLKNVEPALDNRDCNQFHHGVVYLPPKLKLLGWRYCPLKCLPSNFKAEFLVHLIMEYSEIEKMWEGTQQLGSLKRIIMSGSKYLREIPDLSTAVNLKRVDFSDCCKLESFRSPLNSETLEYLSLKGCNSLKNFPQIIMKSSPNGIKIMVEDCLWNKNLSGLDHLDCLRRCYPLQIFPEHIVKLNLKGFTTEKLWEGVQSLGSLKKIKLSKFENLKEIPDLSKATNLKCLNLWGCKSLVTLPSTIGNLQKLEKLDMGYCTGLKDFPVNANLSSLKTLILRGCSSLKSFPQISSSIEELNLDNTAIEKVPCCSKMFRRLTKLSMSGCSSLKTFPQLSHSIEELNLDYTSIEEVPSCIEMLRRLTKLSMHRCSKLKNISPKIFRLTNLKEVDFTFCYGVITMLSDATIKDPYETIEKGNKVDKDKDENPGSFHFQNCLQLDRAARKLIIQSSWKWNVILPGGEVPTYFNHRAFGNSLTITLPQSSLSHQFLRFTVCVVFAKPLLRLHLRFRIDGLFYKHAVYVGWSERMKNHMVLFSFKFQRTGIPSKLDSNNVEFKFHETWAKRVIKEVGIRLLIVSPSLGDRDNKL